MSDATLLEDEPLLEDAEEALARELEELAAQSRGANVLTQEFVDQTVIGILALAELLSGDRLYDYQRRPGQRIIESVLIGDGEEITLLQSRQSGKTQTVAAVFAAMMVALPRLAAAWPELEELAKFKKGFWVGVFAPVDEQALTMFARIEGILKSDSAAKVLADPEIDDAVAGGGKLLKLKKSGSYVRMQTANPKAKIESKSYHCIVIDEAQDADAQVIGKSIRPMLAFYNGTSVLTGTPSFTKGYFFDAIRRNRRRQTMRGARENHFQADWRSCAKANANYARFVAGEKIRLGEDSDEFQLSYALKWLLDRGMFIASEILNSESEFFIGDKGQPLVREWTKTPIVIGVDVARKTDSTVVTAVHVDWDREDAFGYRPHRILNWLEITGEEWERQYYDIVRFVSNYWVLAMGVESQGMGGPVAERLALMLPRVAVHAIPADRGEQSKRWKHLSQLIDRGMLTFPAHHTARRTRPYKRFIDQMEELEKNYVGPYLIAAAPDEANAHDDYPDSLSIACALTETATMPTVQQAANPFMDHRRRRR